MRLQGHGCSAPPAAGLRFLVLAILMLASTQSRAEGKEFLLRYGQVADRYESFGVALHLGSLWSRDWGNWKATLMPELEVNRFRYTGSQSGPDSLDEAGIKGMVRFVRGSGSVRPYAELGLGFSLLSRDRLGTRELSTHFQFSEHVGLGAEFGKGWFAGWRYSHYSNAGIEQPNDGLDMHQAVIGVSF